MRARDAQPVAHSKRSSVSSPRGGNDVVTIFHAIKGRSFPEAKPRGFASSLARSRVHAFTLTIRA
jgi:hypothetical protein